MVCVVSTVAAESGVLVVESAEALSVESALEAVVVSGAGSSLIGSVEVMVLVSSSPQEHRKKTAIEKAANTEIIRGVNVLHANMASNLLS